MNNYRLYTAEESAEVFGLRAEGVPYAAIAKRLGRARSSVWRHHTTAPTPRPIAHPKSDEDRLALERQIPLDYTNYDYIAGCTSSGMSTARPDCGHSTCGVLCDYAILVSRRIRATLEKGDE